MDDNNTWHITDHSELLWLLSLATTGNSNQTEKNQNGGKEEMNEKCCNCKDTKNEPVTVESLRNGLLKELSAPNISKTDIYYIKEKAEALKMISEIQTKSMYESMKEAMNMCCCPAPTVSAPTSLEEAKDPKGDVFVNVNL